MHVVVIGAVALGPKAAARFKRLNPKARVTMIDQSPHISYGGCGIPYYISGEVDRVDELRETPYGVVRDAAFFKTAKDIDVLVQSKATAIDRKAKTVTVRHQLSGEESTIPYDRLVLAMGSAPNMPPIPGLELKGITPCTNLEEAELIKTSVTKGQVNNAVVVGGGFIGLEVAVAFADMWGIPTSVVEFAPHVLPNTLSDDMAAMVTKDLQDHDVNVYAAEKVIRFEGENGKVSKVITDKREIEADLVILSAGVRPATEIATAAGIKTNERGMIIVDEHMRTNDPDIYSGGDCALVRNLITGKEGWFPLGSLANRQGRIIGTNLASESGTAASFPGAVGSWVVKLFEQTAAGAGLTINAALREGYDAINIHVEQLDRAHFYPEKSMMALDLVVDKKDGRVLGIQGTSANGEGLLARINPVAALLTHGPVHTHDLSTLEVAYSPPFAAAMDVVNTIGNVAENILNERCKPISLGEFNKLWEDRENNDLYILDARASYQSEEVVARNSKFWHSIPADEIRKRLDEIPKDKPLVLICNTGLRSYDAQLILNNLGV
ncbi:FAD-dependent oxidoreductase, partial [Desulfovibrio sp. OttesenSCG-928-C06]|nr:FAD-dependent oxidoreductase [Desulfovibrio sp. OttesenSCG-928-C06]